MKNSSIAAKENCFTKYDQLLQTFQELKTAATELINDFHVKCGQLILSSTSTIIFTTNHFVNLRNKIASIKQELLKV